MSGTEPGALASLFAQGARGVRSPCKVSVVGGQPEFPVTDGNGMVWDIIEDKGALIKIDAKTLEILALARCASCGAIRYVDGC